MNILRRPSHVAVVGKSGTGKTSYAERYLVGCHHDRVFIFDHQGEFSVRLHCLPCHSFDEMLSRAAGERFLVFDPAQILANDPGTDLATLADDFAGQVFDFSRHYGEPQDVESLFVCDEFQKVQGTGAIAPRLRTVFETGRRFNLDSLVLSQQPNAIHGSVRNQFTEVAAFKMTDDNSFNFFRVLGIDHRPIANLPEKLAYRWHHMGTGEIREGRIDFPGEKNGA